MTLSEAILKRKSIRSFELEELEPEFIDELADFLSELTVPDDSIDWNFDILPLDDMMKILKSHPGTFASFQKVNEVFGNFQKKV